MASVADFKEEHHPQSWERLKASIRTRISVWIGLAAFVGWVLSRIPPKKRRTYVPGSIQEANYHSGKIKPADKSKLRENRDGLLSLVLELLGAVAIRLVQRYFKSWRSTLIVRLHNPPEPELSSPVLLRLRQKTAIACPITEAKYHQKRLSRKSPTRKV
jgi:hypothetical protein